MVVSKLPIYLVLLASTLAVAQQETTRPATSMVFGLSTRDQSLVQRLNESITGAPADAVFSVQMALDQPASLEQVRAAANELQIPRVLAFVQFPAADATGNSAKVPVAVGELYQDAAAWQHQACRAQIFVSLSRADELINTPIERWSTTEIHVYGSAHAIRELRAGTVLPGARVIDGVAEEQRHLQAIAAATQRELAEKISIPANFPAPAACRSLTEPIDGPVLFGQSTIPADALRHPSDADFRSLLYRQLSERAPATAVTLRLFFGVEVTVEMLASLVEQYRIDGLVAELMPQDGQRRILEIELSVHGASLADQIIRARCRIALANAATETPVSLAAGAGSLAIDAADDWYARDAQVSVTAAAAVQLLGHQDLRDAQFVADFPPDELVRLADYHRRKSGEAVQIMSETKVPDGCRRFFQQQPSTGSALR
jgi:hypothetical protein